MNAENLAPPSLASRLDAIALWSGNIVSWMILPMVLSLTYEVVARYVFSAPTVWAYDMTFMLYGTFFMLGASYTENGSQKPKPRWI
jgi:TRAP-type mannitol/chloroaromatic compound transport system permease small subunit